MRGAAASRAMHKKWVGKWEERKFWARMAKILRKRMC